MAKLEPRPESITVGRYRAYPTGQGEALSWVVSGPGKDGKHYEVANVPDAQFRRDGRRMLECYDQGKPFVASEQFAGEQVDPAVAELRRRKLLESGRDHTLQVGEFERYLASREHEAQGVFSEAVRRYPAQQWPGFERELFASLYGDPEAVEEPHASDEWMARLRTLAGETVEWEQLRAQCKGDPWAAGLGAGRLTTALANEIGNELSKLPHVDPQQLEEEAETREQLKEGAGNKLKEAAEAATMIAAQVDQMLAAPKLERRVRAIVRKVADQAGEEIEGMAVALEGLGCGSLPGVASKVNAPREEIRKLLEKDAKLRRVAAIAGRLKMRARAKQRTKVNYQPEQVVDVTTGDDLQRLVPSEVMLLGSEETELLLLSKLVERRALQYRLEGREQSDSGPVILAVDDSGSMSGDRSEWAMGVALALLEVCALQKRPFCLVHFDSVVQKTFTIEKPGRLDLTELVEMVSYFSGGGTNFAPPLDWARSQIVQRQAAGEGVFAKSDVILVTDGGGSWGKSVQQLKEVGALVYGVAIESSFTASQVEELAGLARVTDLGAKGDGAIELVFGI